MEHCGCMCGSNRTCGVCDTIFDWIAKIPWRNCLGSNSGGFFVLFVSGIKDIDLEIQTLYNKNIKKEGIELIYDLEGKIKEKILWKNGELVRKS